MKRNFNSSNSINPSFSIKIEKSLSEWMLEYRYLALLDYPDKGEFQVTTFLL